MPTRTSTSVFDVSTAVVANVNISANANKCRGLAPAITTMAAVITPKTSPVPRSGWRMINAAGNPTIASAPNSRRSVGG